ncbi:MAG: N-acetylneuraminate synthase family protein [Proteobacteria bacterium]|nr:N-acetylneuraminate synthase family protein [Pseudomonadota bacterium]MBU1698490.1 N-acetylneuraminate synthase family protein [Pseudomonadota bacterium]
MAIAVKIGDRWVGDGHPVFIVAEIGINHNGDVEIAKKLIDAALHTGCDAVKFQKRTPELCVPPKQHDVMRETPWGYITYLEYRHKVEFGLDEYQNIDRYCKERGIIWFASCWDQPSVDFIGQFDPPCYKISSATLTDILLLKYLKQTRKPLILSTGMSTMEQIRAAVEVLGIENLTIVHSTSTYPCPPEELNLRVIEMLRKEFSCPIGYSGHEVGLATTVAAVALSACYVERHITLDRAMWGSDQAASVESVGFERLVKYVRVVESALGDGIKKVYPSEIDSIKRLRQFK